MVKMCYYNYGLGGIIDILILVNLKIETCSTLSKNTFNKSQLKDVILSDRTLTLKIGLTVPELRSNNTKK